MDLPSLRAVLLPELPSVGYREPNSLMVFHTALLLVKEVTSQQMKCGRGPLPNESTVLPVFPAILKRQS